MTVLLSIPGTVAGRYSIEIDLDGLRIFGRARDLAPSIVDVSSVQVMSASTSVVAGAEGQFIIRVQDVFGNRMCTSIEACKQPPEPTFIMEHQTGSTVSGSSFFNIIQSSFLCTYTATVAGTYTISLSIANRTVQFRPTPYVEIVPQKADADSFLFYLNPVYVVGTFTFSMKARDMFLNNVSVGGEFVQVACSFIVLPHFCFQNAIKIA
jgi:hypothetical protein